MKRFCWLFFLFAACPSAHAQTEIGELNHVQFRIDVPDHWNHGLVVYFHGYNPDPVTYKQEPLKPELAVFVKAGYALVQSGYSKGGWAVEQAVPETEGLRQYFIKKYGAPEETYVTGHSMGGLLTMMSVEESPESYDGGLALCGALADTAEMMQRYAFDGRVMFDYYFPGALPSPAKVPADFKMDDALSKRIQGELDRKPQAAATLRRILGAHGNRDLAAGLVFATYVLKDLEERAGGNPFDNGNTIYTGTPNDNALNDVVRRYAADPGALNYLQRYYTPTGRLTRPLLAIHTTYDPVVPPPILESYSLLTRQSGSAKLFVQQYVEHDGHCNIKPEEIDRGFSELRRWQKTGERPSPGGLH